VNNAHQREDGDCREGTSPGRFSPGGGFVRGAFVRRFFVRESAASNGPSAQNSGGGRWTSCVWQTDRRGLRRRSAASKAA